MFRALALLASLVGVSAFAPAGRSPSSALKMDYTNEPGIWGGDAKLFYDWGKPVGIFGGDSEVKIWDPLNLSKSGKFEQYREAEIKHGRVAMLGVLGYIVPEFYRFPGDIAPGVSFSSIPNGVAAIEAVPSLGWFQMVFLIGAVDYFGYLKFGDGGASLKTAEELKDITTKELNNGRLAMIAMLELLRHDSQMFVGGMYEGDHLITGLPFLY